MALDGFIGMLMRGAYLSFHRRAGANFSRLGVTADQYVLLTTLAEEPESLTQRDLADHTYSDENTIRGMLIRFEKKGLVDRHFCAEDGRARRTRLTKRGRALQRKLAVAAAPFHKLLDDSLPEAERVRVAKWLTTVIEEMRSEPTVRRERKS